MYALAFRDRHDAIGGAVHDEQWPIERLDALGAAMPLQVLEERLGDLERPAGDPHGRPALGEHPVDLGFAEQVAHVLRSEGGGHRDDGPDVGEIAGGEQCRRPAETVPHHGTRTEAPA